LHQLIDEMYRSSKIDALTNLLNRRAFEERMEEEFSVTRRHGLSACLSILDIDHFKSINDTYGHDAGDEVLKVVASILKEQVRTGDLSNGNWSGGTLSL
jgi:diguanylate cyclase